MDMIWILLTLLLFSVSGTFLGHFLVLRGTAMLTDALTHALLPAIILGFLVGGLTHSALYFWLGTGLAVISAWLIHFLYTRWMPGREDVALALVYAFFFSGGLLLLDLFGEEVDLDPECVLFGEAAYIPFDTLSVFPDVSGLPRIPVGTALGILLVILSGIFVRFFGYPLYVQIFDGLFARVSFPYIAWIERFFLALLAFYTVASLRITGVILVLVFLVFPSAIARSVSPDTAREFLMYALGVSLLLPIVAFPVAIWLDIPVSSALGMGGLLLLGGSLLFRMGRTRFSFRA